MVGKVVLELAQDPGEDGLGRDALPLLLPPLLPPVLDLLLPISRRRCRLHASRDRDGVGELARGLGVAFATAAFGAPERVVSGLRDRLEDALCSTEVVRHGTALCRDRAGGGGGSCVVVGTGRTLGGTQSTGFLFGDVGSQPVNLVRLPTSFSAARGREFEERRTSMKLLALCSEPSET